VTTGCCDPSNGCGFGWDSGGFGGLSGIAGGNAGSAGETAGNSAAAPESLRDAESGTGVGFSTTAECDGFSASRDGVAFSVTGFGGEV
jgi:hypothetical protein